MLTKQGIGNILSEVYLVTPPKHVFMLDKAVAGVGNGHISFYKGLAPMWRNDVIILAPSATEETVLHEGLHTLGLQEFGANLGGKILNVKRRVLQRRTLFRSFWVNFRGKKIHYALCSGCDLCHDLSKLWITPPVKPANPKHYLLQNS